MANLIGIIVFGYNVLKKRMIKQKKIGKIN